MPTPPPPPPPPPQRLPHVHHAYTITKFDGRCSEDVYERRAGVIAIDQLIDLKVNSRPPHALLLPTKRSLQPHLQAMVS
jgi:hypothetical protein